MIAAGKLHSAIVAVKHAAGKDRLSKWDTASVLVEYRRDAYHVVATDGRRMAYRTTERIDEEAAEEEDIEDDDGLEEKRHTQILIPLSYVEMALGTLVLVRMQ